MNTSVFVIACNLCLSGTDICWCWCNCCCIVSATGQLVELSSAAAAAAAASFSAVCSVRRSSSPRLLFYRRLFFHARCAQARCPVGKRLVIDEVWFILQAVRFHVCGQAAVTVIIALSAHCGLPRTLSLPAIILWENADSFSQHHRPSCCVECHLVRCGRL